MWTRKSPEAPSDLSYSAFSKTSVWQKYQALVLRGTLLTRSKSPRGKREAKGGTRSPAGSGTDACEARIPADSMGRAQPSSGAAGLPVSQVKHGTGMQGWTQAVLGGWKRIPQRQAPIPGDDSARSEGNAPQLPITRAKSLKGGKSKLTPLHPHTLSRIPVRLRSGVSPSTGPAEAAADGPAAGGSLGTGAPPPPFRMLQPPTGSLTREPSSLWSRSAARCRSSPARRDPPSRRPHRPVLTCARRA